MMRCTGVVDYQPFAAKQFRLTNVARYLVNVRVM